MNNKEFNNKEDVELILSSREGNEEAREKLLRKYKSLVCSISRPFYLKGGDDEDLIQEGLITVNTAINNYNINSQASFFTYAYRCIHNKIIDLIRKSDNIDLMEEIEDEKDDTSIEDDVIYKQLVDGLTKVVEDKGTKTDKVILEMFLEGASYKEIADKIGKDIKFVDNKLQKIKKIIIKFSNEWK